MLKELIALQIIGLVSLGSALFYANGQVNVPEKGYNNVVKETAKPDVPEHFQVFPALLLY